MAPTPLRIRGDGTYGHSNPVLQSLLHPIMTSARAAYGSAEKGAGAERVHAFGAAGDASRADASR